jgi:D-alanyl-D-alanine carboxypeptidase
MKTNFKPGPSLLCAKLKPHYLKTFVAAFIFCISITVNAQSFNTNLATKLQDTLDGMIAAFTNTKGMSASVYLPGQGIWTGTGGFSHAGNPITDDMIFGLASNSKLFTSVVMLKLQQSNVLSLDDSLSAWLPPYPNINPNITIRQLLNHTSGVSDPFFTTALLDTVKAHPTQVYTPDDIIFNWLGAPAFAPGGGYQYSNINYILAGMIAENATGFHISQLIRDSILTPLQMDSTFYDIEEPITGILAHRWEAGADLNDTSRISLNTAGGNSGCIFSTAAEMAQWYHALLSGQVINQSSLNEMTNFLMPGNYGLGIQSATIFGHTYWGHSGGTIGYRTKIIYDPCMKAVVVGLVNNSEAAEQGMTALLYKVLLDYLPTCPSAIMGTSNVCAGTTNVMYTVPVIANATSYVWTLPGGATGISATNSIVVDYSMAAVSGDITVCGMNMYGVGAPTSYPVIVNTVPIGITISGDSLITTNATADAYQWVDCNLGYQPIAGETNQNFEPSAIGNYAVIITSATCVDTSACSQINFSGNEVYEPENIFIYPNPSKGIFKINTGNITEGKIQIYNSLGMVIYQSGNLQAEINLSAEPKGTYYLRLFTENKIHSQKIILQ